MMATTDEYAEQVAIRAAEEGQTMRPSGVHPAAAKLFTHSGGATSGKPYLKSFEFEPNIRSNLLSFLG